MFGTGQGAKPGRRLTLYDKLGVSPNASAAEIGAAYEALERAYRPGGAYLDDVMHEAFMGISNAAAILRDPKARNLYDLGFIDETGRTSEAGSERAARRKRGALLAVFLIAAGLFALALDAGPDSNPARPNFAWRPPRKPATEGPSRTASAPPAMRADPRIEKPAIAIQPDPAEAQRPAQADPKDYLPLAASRALAKRAPDAPKVAARLPGQGMSRPAAPHIGVRRAPAPRDAESKPHPQVASRAPSEWRSYFWLGGPRPSEETVLASQTRRSARCLACLTDLSSDCSKTCR